MLITSSRAICAPWSHGVRQGCVLSPRLFPCVLEVALKKWREQLQDGGLDFGDGGIPLLDLRFADDILLFATYSDEAARMLDAFVACLKEVGLELNASKTKILTTQAQPGKTLRTQNALMSNSRLASCLLMT